MKYRRCWRFYNHMWNNRRRCSLQGRILLMCRGSEGKGSEYDIPACAGLFPYSPAYFLPRPNMGSLISGSCFNPLAMPLPSCCTPSAIPAPASWAPFAMALPASCAMCAAWFPASCIPWQRRHRYLERPSLSHCRRLGRRARSAARRSARPCRCRLRPCPRPGSRWGRPRHADECAQVVMCWRKY